LQFPAVARVDVGDAALKAVGIDLTGNEDLKGKLGVITDAVGVEGVKGTFHPIVKANTIVPSQTVQEFAAPGNKDNEISLALYVGNHEKATKNKLVCKVRVYDPDRGPVPQAIELCLDVTIEGNVRVSVKEKSTGKQLCLKRGEKAASPNE
jgi:molecular chaperone DnaK (HSP70)